jgi:hypothetical protein
VCARNKKNAARTIAAQKGKELQCWMALLTKNPQRVDTHNVQKLLFRNELLALEDAFKRP